jgi:hypothetical protein
MIWVRIPETPCYLIVDFLKSHFGSYYFWLFCSLQTFKSFDFQSLGFESTSLTTPPMGWDSLGEYWDLSFSVYQQDCHGAGAFWRD